MKKSGKNRIIGALGNMFKKGRVKNGSGKMVKVVLKLSMPDGALNNSEPPETCAGCFEQLTADKAAGTIELIRSVSGGRVVHKYELPDKVGALFDYFDEEKLFKSDVSGRSSELSDKSANYTLTVSYDDGTNVCAQGIFDSVGLPEDFPRFARRILNLFCAYRFGDALEPSVYGVKRRLEGDYIFCSVSFDDGYKSYYYITDDESIAEGDLVVVPAGENNREAIVEVVKVEYFSEENAPYPIEKTKHIICKYDDEDFNDFDDYY